MGDFEQKVCEFIGRADTKLETIEKWSEEHKSKLGNIVTIQLDHDRRIEDLENKQIKWGALFKWLFAPKRGLIPTLLAGGSFATWLVIHLGG